MKQTWAKAQSLGLAIQMHFVPHFAPQIEELARQFPSMPVVLDHLARAGQGTPAEYDRVLALAKLPKVYMKYSGVGYSSKEKYPFRDAQPIVRKAYDAFGPDRMIWGGLGMNMDDFRKQSELLDGMFSFASESDKAKIRGLTAQKLYRF
jgi:L-fuconolactonase